VTAPTAVYWLSATVLADAAGYSHQLLSVTDWAMRWFALL